MTIDHNAERDASYKVRRAMLGPAGDGHDGTGYAITLRDISNYAEGDPRHVTIPAATLCRVTTSNAGFRGIEAYAVSMEDGTIVSGTSLGAFRADEEA